MDEWRLDEKEVREVRSKSVAEKGRGEGEETKGMDAEAVKNVSSTTQVNPPVSAAEVNPSATITKTMSGVMSGTNPLVTTTEINPLPTTTETNSSPITDNATKPPYLPPAWVQSTLAIARSLREKVSLLLLFHVVLVRRPVPRAARRRLQATRHASAGDEKAAEATGDAAAGTEGGAGGVEAATAAESSGGEGEGEAATKEAEPRTTRRGAGEATGGGVQGEKVCGGGNECGSV